MKIAHVIVASSTILLSGCWFIFIPGSVVSAVSDSVTGAEGAHCVSETAKVGDRVPLPGNGRGTIKSLSGTSVRCTDTSRPIRALIIPDPTA